MENNPCSLCTIPKKLCKNCGWNKMRKADLYKPKKWDLYENGRFIETFPSHSEAKKALHFKKKEACDDWLDLSYEIKPHNDE